MKAIISVPIHQRTRLRKSRLTPGWPLTRKSFWRKGMTAGMCAGCGPLFATARARRRRLAGRIAPRTVSIGNYILALQRALRTGRVLPIQLRDAGASMASWETCRSVERSEGGRRNAAASRSWAS